MDALAAFEAERCSAILRTPHADAVAPAMEAAVDGGFRIVEFTLTVPDVFDHIAAFAARGDLVVGAGTVLTVEDAERAIDAGASFLVSPVTDAEVIGWCAERGILAIPGAATPTEMLTAHRAGAGIVKLFPGPVNGPDVVRACLGPLPFLKLLPTSGATLENTADYFAAGAFGVGYVHDLFLPAAMESRDYAAIRARAATLLDAVRAATRSES